MPKGGGVGGQSGGLGSAGGSRSANPYTALAGGSDTGGNGESVTTNLPQGGAGGGGGDGTAGTGVGGNGGLYGAGGGGGGARSVGTGGNGADAIAVIRTYLSET